MSDAPERRYRRKVPALVTGPPAWDKYCRNCDGSGFTEWGEPPHWIDTECSDHRKRTALWGTHWAIVVQITAEYHPERFVKPT